MELGKDVHWMVRFLLSQVAFHALYFGVANLLLVALPIRVTTTLPFDANGTIIAFANGNMECW